MARRGRPPYPDVLTPRELEVHELLREGLSNPQIAERLDISLDGAKYHVSEILSKLGVASREEAAAMRIEAVRPWWAVAVAPLASLWRKAGALVPAKLSSAALLLSGGLFVVIVAGLGLVAVLLLREEGAGSGPLGPVHSLKFPAEDNGSWPPTELLQGTRTFLAEFSPDPSNAG